VKKTLLIIEDDPDIQRYYEVVLSGPDLEILKASNGEEALSLLDSRGDVDLIILDIIMPIMDGEEFFKIARIKRKMQLPIIISTVDDKTARPLSQMGEVQGLFSKMSPVGDLKELIHQNL
jgi:DNA-binding response OmpR family regulator